MRFSRTPCVAAIASLAFAAPAIAQEDGVTIDPDSPSAKEYAVPFEAERRQADPAQEPEAGIQQGSRSSPPFGVGIESDESRSSSRPAARDDSDDEDRDASARKTPSPDAAPQELSGDDAVIRAATSNPGPPSGGAGVPLTIGGVALGVLLAGGLAGLFLRRRLSRP